MAENILIQEAFVCEITDTTVKLFDCVKNLVEVPKDNFVGELNLATYYKTVDGKYHQTQKDNEGPLHLTLANGFVCTKVVAVAPSAGFLAANELFVKYGKTAYSHMLQLLHDPNDLFGEFPPDTALVATVKYAPNAKSPFEVIEVNPVGEELQEVFEWIKCIETFAPWYLETRNLNAPQPPECQLFHQKQSFNHDGVNSKYDFIGVCFSRNADRFYLYSWHLGIISDNRGKYEVGKWYHLDVVDSRMKFDNGRCHNTIFGFVSQNNKAVEIAAPIITNVTEGNIEMTTSFIFTEKMKGHCDFYDLNLGKVLIVDTQAKQIGKSIWAHTETYKAPGRDLFNEMKKEKVVVEVIVGLRSKVLEKYERDSAAAVFQVKKVVRIFYLIGGVEIPIVNV